MAGITADGGDEEDAGDSTAEASSYTPRASFKADWDDDGWTFLRTAIFDHASLKCGSEAVSSLTFSTPYGDAIGPFLDGLFHVEAALNLDKAWVKLELAGDRGDPMTVFVGQVRGESRQVFGSSSNGATGIQTWSAYGGQLQLRLRAVSDAYFLEADGATFSKDEWSPGFNLRESHSLVRGNRSAELMPDGLSYAFGGSATWTRRQALDYLLVRFANDEDEDGDPIGPVWTLGGQLSVLDEPLKFVEVGVDSTIESLARKLINHREGIEWGVFPTELGYEIRVFTLVGRDVTVRKCTLPANPGQVTLDAARFGDVESCRVSVDTAHMPSRVRLVGERVVVCATLTAAGLSGGHKVPLPSTLNVLDPTTGATLVGKWTTAQEALYLSGATDVDKTAHEDKHDAARASELYRSVYQRYGYPTGKELPALWRPLVDSDGNLTVSGEGAPSQTSVRATLPTTPLREGYDYTQSPPVNVNPDDATEPEFRPPLVVCEASAAEIYAKSEQPDDVADTDMLFTAAHQVGLGYSVLKLDLGVLVEASPNHRLARGRVNFDDPLSYGVSGGIAVSNYDHLADEETAIDARTLAATIAWESDVRLSLEAAVDPDHDDGTVVVVPAPGAHAWWLAPGTIVSVKDGKIAQSPSVGGVELRNDADLLAPVMVGIVARYLFARTRAEVQFAGWKPWLGLLGQILTTVEEAGESHGINAPITSIDLFGGANATPKTVITAGYGS